MYVSVTLSFHDYLESTKSYRGLGSTDSVSFKANRYRHQRTIIVNINETESGNFGEFKIFSSSNIKQITQTIRYLGII